MSNGAPTLMVLTPEEVRPLAEDEAKAVDSWILTINEALRRTRGSQMTIISAASLPKTQRVLYTVQDMVRKAGWKVRYAPGNSDADPQLIIDAEEPQSKPTLPR